MNIIPYKKITALASSFLFSLPLLSAYSQDADELTPRTRAPRVEPDLYNDIEIPKTRQPRNQQEYTQCHPRWFYQNPEGDIEGPYYSCTKAWSDNGTPWCATNITQVKTQGHTQFKNGIRSPITTVRLPTYISGGKEDTTFRECTQDEYLQDYLLGPLPKLKQQLPENKGCPPLDIMFLFDNTTSMENEIAQAKIVAQDTLGMISKLYPTVRFSISTVADAQHYTDKPYQHLSNFTTNIEETLRAINSIRMMDGGDEPEAYPHALRYASNEAWNPLATRLVILIADSFARKDDLLRLSINESNFKLITLVTDENLLYYWAEFSAQALPLSNSENLEGLLLRSVMSGCYDYPQIYFNTNSFSLKKQEKKNLDQFARMITAHNDQQDIAIVVEGHADERGSDEKNKQLAQRRAKAICTYLEQRDIICLAESYGEERPFCQDQTTSCYSQNRRGHLYPIDLASPRVQQMIDQQTFQQKVLPKLKKRKNNNHHNHNPIG